MELANGALLLLLLTLFLSLYWEKRIFLIAVETHWKEHHTDARTQSKHLLPSLASLCVSAFIPARLTVGNIPENKMTAWKKKKKITKIRKWRYAVYSERIDSLRRNWKKKVVVVVVFKWKRKTLVQCRPVTKRWRDEERNFRPPFKTKLQQHT